MLGVALLAVAIASGVIALVLEAILIQSHGPYRGFWQAHAPGLVMVHDIFGVASFLILFVGLGAIVVGIIVRILRS